MQVSGTLESAPRTGSSIGYRYAFVQVREKIVIASKAKQSFPLDVAQIAGGTGILPVISSRQARSLFHHLLLAMTRESCHVTRPETPAIVPRQEG